MNDYKVIEVKGTNAFGIVHEDGQVRIVQPKSNDKGYTEIIMNMDALIELTEKMKGAKFQ